MVQKIVTSGNCLQFPEIPTKISEAFTEKSAISVKFQQHFEKKGCEGVSVPPGASDGTIFPRIFAYMVGWTHSMLVGLNGLYGQYGSYGRYGSYGPIGL